MVLQHMVVSILLIWVLEHTVNRLGLVVVEDSGVALQPVAFLATCLVHPHHASAITSRILILMTIRPLQGRHIGGSRLEVVVHPVVDTAARAQGLPLVLLTLSLIHISEPTRPY